MFRASTPSAPSKQLLPPRSSTSSPQNSAHRSRSSRSPSCVSASRSDKGFRGVKGFRTDRSWREDAMKRYRPSADDIVGALLLPSPRAGRHDDVADTAQRSDDTAQRSEQSAATRWRLPRPRRSADAAGIDADDFASQAPATGMSRSPKSQSAMKVSGALVPSGLSDEVERRLARLAGVEMTPLESAVEEIAAVQRPSIEAASAPAHAHQLLRIAQIVAGGGVFLVAPPAGAPPPVGKRLLRG